MVIVFLIFFRDDASHTTSAPLPATAGAGGATANARTVYARAADSVVSIKAKVPTGTATGTGFLVDGRDTIVTNAHVVGGASTVQVQFGDRGQVIEGDVLGKDTSTDLAVVHIDPASHTANPLPLADSSDVRVGDAVVAIGNPFGLDRTATAGIVSATDRHISAPNGFDIDNVIQTDAPINPGNSGGPLLDARGRVIGINSQIATAGGSNGNVGIGFAVPVNTVRRVVPQLEQGKTIRRAFLGVTTTQGTTGAKIVEVTPERARRHRGHPHGRRDRRHKRQGRDPLRRRRHDHRRPAAGGQRKGGRGAQRQPADHRRQARNAARRLR